MNSSNIYLIVYFAILTLLAVLNFVPGVRDTFGLTSNQKAFLFSSSLFLLLFFGYFAKALVKDKSITMMPFIALYPLWYYITKFIVNKVTSQSDYLSDI
jgi:hypothetical protein